MRTRFTIAAIACAALVMLASSASAAESDQATSPVLVDMPQGFRYDNVLVLPGPTQATKYVVITSVRVANQSRVQPLDVEYGQFKLQTLDGDSYGVNRKVTAARPLSLTEQSLGPGQAAIGDLAFEIPSTVRRVSLWYYVIQFDATYPTSG